MLDVDPETVTNSSHGGGSELAVNQYRLIESSIGQPSSLLTSLRHEGSTAYEGRLSTVSDRLSVRHIAAVSKIPACTVTGVVTILSHRCYVNAYGDMVGIVKIRPGEDYPGQTGKSWAVWAELACIFLSDSSNFDRYHVYMRNLYMADKGINYRYPIFETVHAAIGSDRELAVVLAYRPLDKGDLTYTVYYIQSKILGTVRATDISENVGGIALPAHSSTLSLYEYKYST